MSDQDPPPDDPLSPSLRALLDPERDAGSAPGKARVRARLDASLFGGPPDGGGNDGGAGAPGAGGSTLPGLARVAAIFAAGAVVGGVVVATLIPPRVEIVERTVQVPPSASPSSSEPVTARAPTITHPIDSAAESASASASAPSSASASAPSGDTLAQERAILDTARTAIGRRDGASALEAVRRHEAKHPSGKLVEEREAIAVQALVLLGRQDDARARGAKFLGRWPDSVLVPTVRAAIGD